MNRRQAIVIGAANGIAAGAVLGVLAGAALVSHAAPTVTAGPTYHRVPLAVAQGHRCWAGQAPQAEAGKVPGGVVVTRHEGGAKVYLHTPAAVGAALDHVFKGTHPGMTVWAFCA